MVKFAFASVFLVLSALSAVVFAAPAAYAKYSIKIKGTDYFIFSDGHEKPGELVTIVPKWNRDTTVVSIDFKPSPSFKSAVIGKTGLYVTVLDDVQAPPFLIWEKKHTNYAWTFKNVVPFTDYVITTGGDAPYYWARAGKNLEVIPAAKHGDIFMIERVH